MEAVCDDHLHCILGISDQLMEEMKMKYNDYRKQWIVYWLETSAHASWSKLGGGCLLYTEKQALSIIESFIETTNKGNVH